MSAETSDACAKERDGYRLLQSITVPGTFESWSSEHRKYSMLCGKIICLEGIISAGKTTLGDAMVVYLNNIGIHAQFYREQVNNEVLAQFYQNPRQYAFAFQIYMLRSCMANLALAKQRTMLDGAICIVDRSTWGNAVFASMHMMAENISEREWVSYRSLLDDGGPHKSHYVIYLDCDPQTCYNRAKNRARDAENEIACEYFAMLERYYTTQMLLHVQQRTANVVPIDWENFGSPRMVLDCLLSNRSYQIEGDLKRVFDGDRRLRANVVRTLASEGSINVDNIQIS
jgi:deoxyadenosine/deoxycytidine kinase